MKRLLDIRRLAVDGIGNYNINAALTARRAKRVENMTNILDVLECGGFTATQKPLEYSTLQSKSKEELIRRIRILESNCEAVSERNENQLKYIETLKREIVSDIVADLEKNGITMSTAKLPHNYFKAISVKKAVEIIKNNNHFK